MNEIIVPIVPMHITLEHYAQHQKRLAEWAEEREIKHRETVQEYVNRIMEKINQEIGTGSAAFVCYRKNAQERVLFRSEKALDDALECIKKALESEGYKTSIYYYGPYYAKILTFYVNIR